MKKYEVVLNEPCQEWTIAETENEIEATNAARAEAKRTGSAEGLEIRADIQADECGVMSWNAVPFLWQFKIKPYRSNAEVFITRRADAGEQINHSIDLGGCREFSSDELIEGWQDEIETVLYRANIELIPLEKTALNKMLNNLYDTIELMLNM